MKAKLALLALMSTFVSPAVAATYTFNNGAGATASGIQTVEGWTFRSDVPAGTAFATGGGTSAGPGVFAVGVFTSDDLSGVTSPAQLVSLFVNFGGNVGTSAVGGPVGARSIFSVSGSAPVGGTQFDNRNIYFVAGNGTTLAGSDQFVVFKSNSLFLAAQDDVATAQNITFRPDQGETLFGSVVPNVQTTNSDTSTTAGWEMAIPIPEPSTALLGLIGALGLLRRRR